MRISAGFSQRTVCIASSELARASRSATSLGPVCDQLQTCLRPDSVMEFDFEPVCDQVRAGSSYLDMISI